MRAMPRWTQAWRCHAFPGGTHAPSVTARLGAMHAVSMKMTWPGAGRVERALAGALAHALRLALANRHSRTVRGAAALLSAEDEADVAEAFAALPAGGAAGSAKEARAAHTALVGHVARRLRDPEAAREPADLGARGARLHP